MQDPIEVIYSSTIFYTYLNIVLRPVFLRRDNFNLFKMLNDNFIVIKNSFTPKLVSIVNSYLRFLSVTKVTHIRHLYFSHQKFDPLSPFTAKS